MSLEAIHRRMLIDTKKRPLRVLAGGTFWAKPADFYNQFKKQFLPSEDIVFVDTYPADYYVIVNSVSDAANFMYDPSRTIVFRMEPNMHLRPDVWGKFATPSCMSEFMYVACHEKTFNNIEWWLSKTAEELLSEGEVQKVYQTEVSAILSGKHSDEGHVARIAFAKAMDADEEIALHVFGKAGTIFGFKNDMGLLPQFAKDAGLAPYKYTFNAENHSIDGYFTEKIVDAILSECLIFYWGCPNLEKYIHPDCFVRLDLKDAAASLEIVKRAIREDWWSQRIATIRAEKKRIVSELQFFPRVQALILENERKRERRRFFLRERESMRELPKLYS
jgi:hypothetical protein